MGASLLLLVIKEKGNQPKLISLCFVYEIVFQTVMSF